MKTRPEPSRSIGTRLFGGILATLLVVAAAFGWSAYEAERERQRQSEQLADGTYFAATEIARLYGAQQAAGWCAIAGAAALGPIGAGAGYVFCGMLTYGAMNDVSETLHQTIFGRPYHPEAAAFGRIVGVIGGAVVLLPDGYPSYASEVRVLSEQTYRSHGATIDPGGLRGAEYHLHHVMPVRCGFALGIPAWLMASGWNLEMLTAQANRRIGAMGCED